MRYAEGVIDNHFRYYVRDDGMAWHRAEELPASARTLTLLALHHAYAGGDGGARGAFALRHFSKAREIQGDTWRCREIQGDTGGYRERDISKARALARVYLPLSP